MKNMFKRIVSLLMVLVLAGSMLPVTHAHGEEMKENTVLTDEDYAIVNDVFAQIDAMEDAPAKKSASRTQITDAAAEIVMASENYVEGSLERNGNSFTWWTDEGIRCIYNPRMREIQDNMVAPENPTPDGAYNEPLATKGGWPSGNQVYLIGPYYGSDANFTDQYKNEAKAIANAIGDTDGYTLYSGSSATIDNVAKAISNGAVVIFDSHGNTDYENPENEYDCVTGANYSYLCLSTNSGMTNEDYADGVLWDGTNAFVSGDAIANHMTKNSPSGILWMAICLGMATDTMCAPMREKGVEVVCGYSESVFFDTEYIWEELFWDNMCAGENVATSIADMKATAGSWDCSEQMYSYANWAEDDYGPVTMQEARDYYYAFPVVVSDEDSHPGQRTASSYGADSLQTVKSTYTLFSQYAVTAQSNNTAYGTVSVSGSTITAKPATGYFAESATVVSGTATVSQNGNTFTVVAESDCTVQINFAPKTAVTVNFAGANVSGLTGYAGDAMALPIAEAPEGYQLVGWTTAPLSSETTEKPDCYTDSFVPTGNTTLYALYSYVDTTSGGGSGDYVKVTSTPSDWSGEYLIVYENGTNAYIFNSVDAVDGYLSATISDDTIESNATTDAEAVTIEAMSGGYAIKSKNGYIYGTSGSNKLNFDTSSQQLNTLSMSADGTVLITSNTSVLRFNAASDQLRFRYYKSGQQAITLYVKDGSAGTTYYTSSLCDHTNVNEVAAVAPTCTETGFTAGTQCADCGSYVTGHEVVAALGHSWSDWTQTTAPGCETAGEQTRTCGSCGKTETQSVAATGHNVGEGTVTTPATCTAEGVMTYTCQNCGETETESIPMTEHSYIEDGQMQICSVCGSILDNSTLKAGDQVVIFAPAYNKALSVNKVSTYYNAGVDVTVSGDTVTGYTDTEVWTVVENADGSYSFAYGGQNLGMADSYTSMDLGQSHDAWNVISLGGGLYNVQNTGRGHYMEWYAAKNNWSGYETSNAATDDRLQISFYVIGKGILGADATQPDTSEPEVTEPEVTEPQTDTLSIADAVALGASMEHNTYTTKKYYVTGEITEVYNTTYGNMYITDGNGNTLTIYGTYDATGTNRYDAMTVKPVAGDTVTIYGIVGQYGGTAQIKNGWITEHIPAEEPDTSEPDASEPVDPEPSEPVNPGQITSLQYVFSNYAAGTQYAQGEVHELDDTVTLTVNGAHLNTQVRLYAGSNVVFTSQKVIDSIVVNAGKESATMNVYGSTDGETWDLICAQSVVSTYKDYTIEISGEKAYTFLKLEAVGKQIRIPQMTINVVEPVEEVDLIAGMSMVLGADLQVNMHLNVREDVIVNVGGEDIPFTAEELTEDEDGTYLATVSVAAAQMTEIITVRLAGEEIDPYAPAYSIRAYADAILADSQYSDYHALVKEMLNYGGKAQLYFDPDAEDLANAGITDVEANDVPESTTELSVGGTLQDISFYAASLVYRDKVALRFYFKTTAEAINGYTFKANGEPCTPVQKGDYYYIEVADITPDKLDQQVTVVVTGAGDATLTVSYSPMNYIVRMSAKGGESLKALLKALYNYHLAAKALVNAN